MSQNLSSTAVVIGALRVKNKKVEDVCTVENQNYGGQPDLCDVTQI